MSSVFVTPWGEWVGVKESDFLSLFYGFRCRNDVDFMDSIFFYIFSVHSLLWKCRCSFFTFSSPCIIKRNLLPLICFLVPFSSTWNNSTIFQQTTISLSLKGKFQSLLRFSLFWRHRRNFLLISLNCTFERFPRNSTFHHSKEGVVGVPIFLCTSSPWNNKLFASREKLSLAAGFIPSHKSISRSMIPRIVLKVKHESGKSCYTSYRKDNKELYFHLLYHEPLDKHFPMP